VPVIGRGPLRVAVLVKQVPAFDALELGVDGRLVRSGPSEMNPFCRRAVTKGIELAEDSGGSCTVLTLGPPSAEDCLREAVACGANEGVLVTDPKFAGSDTLATARALAAALRLLGPFDLVLCGRNSVDAETAQVPAQVAELLGLPLAAGVRGMDVFGDTLEVFCEHDDGVCDANVRLPALITCAERLTDPAKAPVEERAAVSADLIRRLSAQALGAGPWGDAASPTTVGQVVEQPMPRQARRLTGDLDEQVLTVARLIREQNLDEPAEPWEQVPLAADPASASGAIVAVFVEPDQDRETRELLGQAAMLAQRLSGRVVALGAHLPDPANAGSWGADELVRLDGGTDARSTAAACADWAGAVRPWAILAPSTLWGREVSGRVAARLGAGLAGDATAVEVAEDGRLRCWKPAFGGGLVAEVGFRSAIQLATVRSGVLPLLRPRTGTAALGEDWPAPELSHRLNTVRWNREDEIGALAAAKAVIALGVAVGPEEYGLLEPLRLALGAELAATRKVADQGWQPRSRQIGITGRSVAPRVFLAVGTSGNFKHLVGARRANLIVAINNDPQAPVFDGADLGIVADWRIVVPRLAEALRPAGVAHLS
jgi:electron transfer flavoprotein alpha subunit